MKNYLFIHIPKTGGTSVKSLLPGLTRDKLHHTRIPPGGIKEVIEQKDAQDSYKFAFVRNVWDRHLSNYIHFKSITKEHWLYKYDSRTAAEVQAFPDFKQFCLGFKNRFNKFHFQPQHLWVYDGDNLELDFVGRYELIDYHFDRLCKKLRDRGFDEMRDLKLPCKNKHPHEHYTKYYDEESIAAVAEQYKKDIELFGYEFGTKSIY